METTVSHWRLEKLSDTLRKFVRRGARANIEKLLRRVRPEDVAVLLRDLTPSEQIEVFEVLAASFPESAGEVLTELESPQRLAILERLSAEEVAGLIRPMSVDDAVFIVESLPDSLRETVLDMTGLGGPSEVETHLTYSDDTAGRIMDSELFSLPEGRMVSEAIEAIQQAHDIDMISYLYVTDDDGHLVGVVSLRQLLLSPPQRLLSEVMTRSVIKVHTDTDQEDVAQLAARYDLLAIPVVDEGNHLAGIVTVDDILDILKEEATEDFLKMVGTSEDELLYSDHSLKVARIRLPWLLVTLLGLIATGVLLEHFQVGLKEALFLLTFVPVIMGMGGNIGSQTSTLAVRGLATGRIGSGRGRIGRFLWQQVKIGLLLALVCSVVVAIAAILLDQNPYLALVVGVALFLAIVLASLTGALVPILFSRLGIDPAVAAGPLVTTSNDILGILIYFGLATTLINLILR
ncbi:MAG TPA: magnesium transporter [Thermoanaerobaculia bacterium]|nr:magnesium transporter [Thermoanaerobaculia bacterium]